MNIRKAKTEDLSRIAEIYVFNNRVNYFPIFKDESFSFAQLQVISIVDEYFKQEKVMENIYVFDDGVIRGFIEMNGTQLSKIYVDSFFQSQGVGDALIRYATEEFGADNLWALEKNKRAISFYQNHGFQVTGRKRLEENTTEYLVKLER